MKRSIEKRASGPLLKNRLIFLTMLQMVIVMLVLPSAAFSASIALNWDPSTDADLGGYKVYYQANSPALPFQGTGAAEGSAPIDVANNVTATVDGLDPGSSYFFAVTAYNSAGIESVYSNVIEIPESLPPVVSITSPSNNASVDGLISIAATASDNLGVANVQFYLNDVLQTTDSAAPYLFTWDTSALVGGVYTVSAKAFDAAGNVGQSDVVVTVAGDTSAPTVSLTAPGNNASVSGNVTVTASASDDVGVTKVQVYDNGVLAFASNQNPASFTWNSLLAANGNHTLSADAYDAAGNIGHSANVVVTVANDFSAPTVALETPANGTAGGVVSGVVGVSAHATDDIGVTKVEFYLNDALESVVTEAPYGFNWNTAAVANGSYTLSAKAYDAAGKVGQSASVIVNVFNDKTAPTVSIASPVNNGTAGGSVAVSANASDNVAVSKVEFYLNGALQATSTSAPYGFNWNTSTVANGAYTLTAKAHDAAGNVGQSASLTVNVFNDTAAPTVSIASPVNNSTAGGSVAVSASASDNVAVSKVEFYLNGALQATSTSAPYGFNWNTAAVANGAYTLTAKAHDAAGNVSQSASVTVNVFNDKTAPTVAIAGSSAISTTGGVVNVTANASDNVGVTKVEFYVNGVLMASSTSAPYGFNWNTGAVANGSYTLSAKAYDAVGNVGQSSLAIVTVDKPLADTSAPTVSFLSPTSNYVYGTKVGISSSATDNVVVTKLELYIDGVLKLSTTNSSFSSTWKIPFGLHTLTVKAYDAANNVTSASKTVNRFY